VRRAAITGLGSVCSLGLDVAALWTGLSAGVQAVQRCPALAARGLDLGPLAKVTLPGEVDAVGGALLDGSPRATMMAQRAAAEAWQDAGLSVGRSEHLRLGICVGTTLGEKAPWVQGLRAAWGLESGAASARHGCSALALALSEVYGGSRLRVVSTACASGNAALGVALQWIRRGVCDVVLCGGVDALSEFVISGFHCLRAHSKEPSRPFDGGRTGLNLGEGAGFLVLEAAQHAQQRGQRIRAFLDGYGLACDANHMTGPDRQGRGAARAMRAALLDAQALPADVDFVSAHGTATIFNDLMEARGLELLLGERVTSVPTNSIKGSVGHTLGAAGALEAVMAVRAIEEQQVPPTAGLREQDPQIGLDVVVKAARAVPMQLVLSTSSGFGGVNAAVVLRSATAVRTK
jgi:3-oxoacyl-[acyl-carrier-protein] synthase II